MLAIQCPSCQHHNSPGDRFCAVCGVPLHLKPCPDCSTVDLVTAKICINCGAVFPPISLAQGSEAIHEELSQKSISKEEGSPNRNWQTDAQSNALTSISTEVPSSRALPLILVAVVAGGIPLMWMNRDLMPLPKAWKIQGGANETTVPVQSAPIVPEPVSAQVKPSISVKGAEGADKSVTERVNLRDAESGSVEAKTMAAQAGQTPKSVSEAGERNQSKPDSATQVLMSPTRECTEGVAALGLCESKQNKK